ncbi:MAG: Maf family protein [Termitinemataceae bacterium]|nr:MAG: Maf family protein [Termitinemataceae bacterium]
MEPILLASGSLRRQDYFKMLKIPFKILKPSIEETNPNNLSASELALDLAKRKVEKTISILNERLPNWIFAADTLVSLDNEIFGKSADRVQAESTLKKLSGREHEVWTACALYNGRTKNTDCRICRSTISFVPFSEEDLQWYLDLGEWQGSAGSYKIQGVGACFVKKIEGSYSSVVGLPLHLFYTMLIENGYPMHSDVYSGK